jgi:predicted HAD superfamily phosphohydrolase
MDQIEANLQQIESHLDFLIGLSPEERRTMRKMGNRLTSFVEKALEAAKQNRQHLPVNFDIEAFERDLRLAKTLIGLQLRINKLLEPVSDTAMLAGSEAIKKADQVYAALKQAAKVDKKLDYVVAELGSHYQQSARGEEELETEPENQL